MAILGSNSVTTAITKNSTWFEAIVREITYETSTVRTIVFQMPSLVDHLAGQHYEIRLTASDGYQAARLYSAASAANNDNLLEVTIMDVIDGEVSPYLTETLKVGDIVEIRGPLGKFFVWKPTEQEPILLIGGGSGIVPMRSILQAHNKSKSMAPMRLIYSARGYSEIIYKDELLDMAEVIITLTGNDVPIDWNGSTGRVDANLIKSALRGLTADTMCYVCGMTPFVEAVAELLQKTGVSPARIKAERFG
jgi:ferredoxin-NADP reductase